MDTTSDEVILKAVASEVEPYPVTRAQAVKSDGLPLGEDRSAAGSCRATSLVPSPCGLPGLGFRVF